VRFLRGDVIFHRADQQPSGENGLAATRGAVFQIAFGLNRSTHLFLKKGSAKMGAIEFALRADPQPDRSYRYPAPCPLHPHGDEARLDYRAEGWPGKCKMKHNVRRCVRVWRASILCDALFQVCYCESALPDELRRRTELYGCKSTAALGTVTALAGGVAKTSRSGGKDT
jgi:hypothetical protein